jgi:hypothetical protein
MEIERVNFPFVPGGNGKGSVNGCESSDGGECFIVVDSFHLGKSFRNDSDLSFVFFDFAF